MPSVALVTCAHLPEPDPDQEPLLENLRAAGVSAEMMAWDVPSREFDFDLCVFRSCWNYYENPSGFLDWVDLIAGCTPLSNPRPVVRWNLHKGYLRELEDAGLPVVPTMWFQQGDAPDLRDWLRDRGWHDVVIKPAISAASYRTARFRAEEWGEAETFLDHILADGDAMVQPFMRSFEDPGERALVWIDGEVTHAVVKTLRFAGEDERVSEAREVTPKERELVTRALSLVDGDLLYARLDTVVDSSGRLCISELELIEPSLFLVQSPRAMNRFVRALGRRLGAGTG